MFKRFLKYALVGLQISVLHWAMLYCLTEFLGLWYMFSTMTTTILTSLFGFTLNSKWTWSGHKPVEMSVFKDAIKSWKHPIEVIKIAWKSRFVRYYFVGVMSIGFGWLQVYVYTEYLGLWYMLSSVLGTMVVMTSTFIIRDKWIWKDDNKTT